MNMPSFIQQLETHIPVNGFVDSEVANLIQGSDHRRYGLVKRALASGELIWLKRGVYCFSPPHQPAPLNLLEIAQRIYGPSYISFESALAFHGLIPEAVRTVTSASLKRSQEYQTPLGVFSFHRVRSSPLFSGVRIESTGKSRFLVATPWKAIADYISFFKKEWAGTGPLVKSLRINEDILKNIDWEMIAEIEASFKDRRVRCFFQSLRKELRA